MRDWRDIRVDNALLIRNPSYGLLPHERLAPFPSRYAILSSNPLRFFSLSGWRPIRIKINQVSPQALLIRNPPFGLLPHVGLAPHMDKKIKELSRINSHNSFPFYPRRACSLLKLGKLPFCLKLFCLSFI